MFEMFRRSLVVERKAKGGFISGEWQDGATISFNILASVQGTNAEVLQTMPEGASSTATYTLRTSTKLMTSIAGESTPDVVIIDDERFFVMRVTPWQNLQHTKHYEVVVVRDNTDAD